MHLLVRRWGGGDLQREEEFTFSASKKWGLSERAVGKRRIATTVSAMISARDWPRVADTNLVVLT